MKIGLSYDLKDSVKAVGPAGVTPEDALEEYDTEETVNGIAAALESLGHTTERLGGGREFLISILKTDVDLVFNIAEGRGISRSREAQVPSVLEMLGIPHSGSDPATLCVAHDKPLAKKLVAAAGITTPRWELIESPKKIEEINWASFPFPVFLKPAYEGSSKGVRIASRVENVAALKSAAFKLLETYEQPVLAEEYIDGEEVTVGMIGNNPTRVIGTMRVVPKKTTKNFVYSLEVKRDYENLVDYECPAKLSQPVLNKIEETALQIFRLLGCRDVGRLDMRIDRNGEPYFLEINPLPGLNPRTSDLSIMARLVGMSYESLIAAIFNAARGRYPQCPSK